MAKRVKLAAATMEAQVLFAGSGWVTVPARMTWQQHVANATEAGATAVRSCSGRLFETLKRRGK